MRTLTEIRRQWGLSQRALARRARISHTYVQLIEQGTRRASEDVIYRIADAVDARALERTGDLARAEAAGDEVIGALA